MSTPAVQLIRRRIALAKAPASETLVGLALLGSAVISILLTRIPGGIALFWPGSAIAAVLLIRLPRIRWGIAAFSVMAALCVANVVAAHRSWTLAALFSCVNVAEITMMVAAFRFVWKLPYPDITISQAAFMTAVFGIVLPGVAAMAGGFLLYRNSGIPLLQGTLQWWSSHTIGACFLGPPLILFSSKGLRRLVQGRFLFQNALILCLCLLGCYVTICYVRFPFVVIGLLLLIAAFRIGGFGASLISLCTGLMITVLWLHGIRPIGLDPNLATSGSLLGLPVIALLCTVLAPIAVGLGSDARRSAARASRVSERRFRESMAHSPIGMLISDLNGVWSYSNIALQKMLGYTAEEFRALPPGGPSKAEDWEGSQARRRRLLSGEIDFYDTVRCFQHKDGRWVWTHVAVSLLRDEDGAPIHLIAQIESLEARRHAEAKLAEERERLKITLQSITDAVITTDAAAHITYINAAAESLLGLDMNSIVNRRVDEVIHLVDPQTSKAAANLIGQSALHARMFRREQACLLHRPDGTVCYVTDVVSPVLDAGGLLSGMVIVLHDATLEIDRDRDLKHRATHDPLTGLGNRNEFELRLRAVFAKSRHLNRPAALLAIDLDRFKAVNDAAGHAAGDLMLCKVAEACRIAVRSSDTVARMGGDEFAILLENCAQERADFIGQKILRALNPLRIEWQGSQYEINASIGLAMNNATLSDEVGWFEAADQACFVAKRQGRGRLHIAHTGLDASPIEHGQK
jgi:diguanylate cyclase